MLEAAGKPLLALLMERLARSRKLNLSIVATSSEPQDDVIARLCEEKGYPVFRGSERDVLDRYYQAARQFGLDVIVRITSDCPLIDPALVDEMIDIHLAAPDRYDLITNRHPLTFPDGLDVDVMSLGSLTTAWTNATTHEQREHTIPYFWQAGLRVLNVTSHENLFHTHRWTLDYPEDYSLIKSIFESLYENNPGFGTAAILDLLADRPELSAINARYLPVAAV